MRRILLAATVVLSLVALPAAAHEERPSQFPSGNGTVPTHRTPTDPLVVCPAANAATTIVERVQNAGKRAAALAMLADCEFNNIQDAVDAASTGDEIVILPGTYLETESLAPPTPQCAALEEARPLSYEQQMQCPHLDNLIALFGDDPNDSDIACDARCNLQLEGFGDDAEDVVVDGGFHKLNVFRADRADGVYFRNFTAQHSTFNALYVMETDGFAIDGMVGRNNDEYGFLTFASDHGLYLNCEAYGNGDSGVYPGSAADLHGVRPAMEITGCRSHHNLLGYSGTAGNSVYAHDNVFDHNAAGVSMDSFFPNHPGLPQDSATFVNNLVYSNNSNYYDNFGTPGCAAGAVRPVEQFSDPYDGKTKPLRAVCPTVPVPVGTGILVAGGNANTFDHNWVYDNWRFGAMLFFVPASLREEFDPTKQFDTSHFNRYLENRMGRTPSGLARPNGLDFWWDEEGEGNCWQGNVPATGRTITSDPAVLPTCDAPSIFTPGNSAKQAQLAPCATWSAENHHPPGCNWMETPAQPA